MKKYLCIGGKVMSKTDGDIHHVPARRLAELYNVNPEECVFIDESEEVMFARGGRAGMNSMIILRPSYQGNYKLPTPREG